MFYSASYCFYLHVRLRQRETNVTFFYLFWRLFVVLCVMFILTFLENITQNTHKNCQSIIKRSKFPRMFFFHLKYSFFSSYLFITWFDISYMNDKTVSLISFVVVISLLHTTPTVRISPRHISRNTFTSLYYRRR